jgi:hypothetical protein
MVMEVGQGHEAMKGIGNRATTTIAIVVVTNTKDTLTIAVEKAEKEPLTNKTSSEKNN